MTQAEAVKAIRGAARKRERAMAAREAATDELRRYCREAVDAKVPISQIARYAGLSRQGVYDLLGQ